MLIVNNIALCYSMFKQYIKEKSSFLSFTLACRLTNIVRSKENISCTTTKQLWRPRDRKQMGRGEPGAHAKGGEHNRREEKSSAFLSLPLRSGSAVPPSFARTRFSFSVSVVSRTSRVYNNYEIYVNVQNTSDA